MGFQGLITLKTQTLHHKKKVQKTCQQLVKFAKLCAMPFEDIAIYLPNIYLPIYLSIYLFTYLFIYLHILTYLSIFYINRYKHLKT